MELKYELNDAIKQDINSSPFWIGIKFFIKFSCVTRGLVGGSWMENLFLKRAFIDRPIGPIELTEAFRPTDWADWTDGLSSFEPTEPIELTEPIRLKTEPELFYLLKVFNMFIFYEK